MWFAYLSRDTGAAPHLAAVVLDCHGKRPMTLALCRDVSQCGETVYPVYGLKPCAWAEYGLLKSGLRLVYLLAISHRGNNNGECYNESLPVVPSLPAAREELKASVYFPG